MSSLKRLGIRIGEGKTQNDGEIMTDEEEHLNLNDEAEPEVETDDADTPEPATPESEPATPNAEDAIASDSSDVVQGRPARERAAPTWLRDYECRFLIGDEVNVHWFDDHALQVTVVSGDPMSYEEAVIHSEWRRAAKMDSIERNETWELTEVPAGVKTIGVKWVYKTKYNEDGEVDKFKARLVAKGYAQRFGVDYNEVFAPVGGGTPFE